MESMTFYTIMAKCLDGMQKKWYIMTIIRKINQNIVRKDSYVLAHGYRFGFYQFESSSF